MSPQRYNWSQWGNMPDPAGGWVTYADHVAAVAERETDLLSCHKDHGCRDRARIAGVIAEDIQSELIDGGDTR